jgi:hypothetical protein
MKFANIAGFVKLRDDIAASQALITRTEWQIAFCNVIAHAIRVLTCVLLAGRPLVQIRDAKAPAFADVASWDYSAASHLLQRLRMNAEKSSRFQRIEQGFEFSDREAGLSGGLSRV